MSVAEDKTDIGCFGKFLEDEKDVHGDDDLERIDITPNKDGGVLKTLITAGEGRFKPIHGDKVYVHYVGRIDATGEVFDSSNKRGESFAFNLGQNSVIKGWELGVATMKKGEKCILICRSDYAYGNDGYPPKVMADETLRFEIELLRWEGEDLSPESDKTILRSFIEVGEKYTYPSDGAKVKVSASGSYGDRVFFEKEVEFILGEATAVGLPEGVDRALRRFCRGEKSMISLKGTQYTYGKDAPCEYNLPPNAELQFTIFLKDFEKIKKTWELTDEEKLEEAEKVKDRGVNFYKEFKYKLALVKFKYVESLLQTEYMVDAEKSAKRKELLLAAYCNSALAYLKGDETRECIEMCDKALALAPNNVKALFRKAEAHLEEADFDTAISLYQKVGEIEPTNKAVASKISLCKQRSAKSIAKQKRCYKKLFGKLSATDENETMKENIGTKQLNSDDSKDERGDVEASNPIDH